MWYEGQKEYTLIEKCPLDRRLRKEPRKGGGIWTRDLKNEKEPMCKEQMDE